MKESESRDRVISENRTDSNELVPKTEQMELTIDCDVQEVLEFMQGHIPACKLVGVAENVAAMARLLWAHNPQEPVRSISLTYLGPVGAQPRAATESCPDTVNAGDGSEVGAVCP